MRTSTGLSTEAVFIFTNMLRKLSKTYKPEYIAAVFESIGPTLREQALNSLGIGGTNAFVLLEEAPLVPTTSESPDHSRCLVTLSAKTAEALVARVQQLLNWLNDNPDTPIGDLCFTTNVSRSQFAYRFAAPARSFSELKKNLEAWLLKTGQDSSSLKRTSNGPVAFMFSGQGPQHAGMAADLYRTHSVFRNSMDRCHALAAPHLESGLLDVIFAEHSDDALVNRTDYTQPALFAVEYALAELLKSWGIAPDAVIGTEAGDPWTVVSAMLLPPSCAGPTASADPRTGGGLEVHRAWADLSAQVQASPALASAAIWNQLTEQVLLTSELMQALGGLEAEVGLDKSTGRRAGSLKSRFVTIP
jgi:acyl transferase domain-containing protein